jgi:hypothetical protein
VSMRDDRLAMTIRTVLSGIYAIALIPACLLAIAVGMALGGPDVGWSAWISFALAGFVGPPALFLAMLKTWPWTEGEYEPAPMPKILTATAIALASYAVVWLVLEL